MKVYLQIEQTLQYYAPSDRWVLDPKQGFEFGSIEQAIRTKEERNLATPDVVVIVENPTRVIRLTASGRPTISTVQGPSPAT